MRSIVSFTVVFLFAALFAQAISAAEQNGFVSFQRDDFVSRDDSDSVAAYSGDLPEYYFYRDGQKFAFDSLQAAVASAKSGPLPNEYLDKDERSWGVVDEYRSEVTWELYVPRRQPIPNGDPNLYRGRYRTTPDEAIAQLHLTDGDRYADGVICGDGVLQATSDYYETEYVENRSGNRYLMDRKDHLYTGKYIPYEYLESGESCSSRPWDEVTVARSLRRLTPVACEDYFYWTFDASPDRGWREFCRNSLRVKIFGPIDDVCEPTAGNPCGLLSGKKRQIETDYASPNWSFKRYYASNRAKSRKELDKGVSDPLGEGWRHSFSASMTSDGGSFYFYRPNGTTLRFKQNGDGEHFPVNRLNAFVYGEDGYIVLEVDGQREYYDLGGVLRKVRTGSSIFDLTYDSEHRLTTVMHNKSETLSLEYDADSGLVSTLRLPSGETISYEQSENLLTSVTYQDGTSRIYHYAENESAVDDASQGLLTGISDESGARISSYSYDHNARLIETVKHGESRVTFVWNPNEVIVKDAVGAESRIQYKYINNMPLTVDMVGDPCAVCVGVEKSAIEYDENGWPVKWQEGSDQTHFVEYDIRGRQTRHRLESRGSVESDERFEYAGNSTKPNKIAGQGRVIESNYDANGNRLSETITDSITGETRTTSWTYDLSGKILTVDGPRTDVNDVTTYTYDASGNISTITNALGHVTQYPDYDAHGNPLRVIDANGVVTELEYDLRQRLVRRTIAAGTAAAASTRFEYDSVGLLTRTTLPNNAWAGYEYDPNHRLIAILDSAGNRVDYVLDSSGHRIEEVISGTNGETFREILREYNELGRLVTQAGPEGSRADYLYDRQGNLTSITDAAGNSTTRRFDALNRLFKIVDALGGITAYQYDPRDNLTQVVDPRGVITDYTYNGFNELVETRSPDAGTTTYTYDAAGNRVTQTDARGITVHYAYDALNRLIFIDYPEPTDGSASQDITYTYDQGMNGIGRLSRIDDETGRTTYSYDTRGNLAHKLSVVNSESGEQYLPVGYSFDAADNLASMTYPSGTLLEYQRDAHGRVISVSLTNPDGTQTTLASQLAYVPFGPLRQLTFGNGVNETRSFDREGRITGITSSALSYGYTWSNTGNITAITDNLDGTRSQTFGYDALYRLTDAAGLYGNLNWQYDAVGNRLRETDNGADTVYGYTSESNRLVTVSAADGSASYLYDANGNTLDNGKNTFAYDARNRFVEADGLYSYRHNALGQRVLKPRIQGGITCDANNDSVIDENDLHALHDMLKKSIPISKLADCNQDGSVDRSDNAAIAQHIGGSKNNGKGKTESADGLAASQMDSGARTIAGQILFVYDEAGHLVGEYDEVGNRVREYVWLGDRPLAMVQDDGVYYIHSDHLNTPKVVTDGNQSVVWRADYKPFGEAELTVTTLDMPLRFPGQFFDSETNLHYNFYRNYNPATGRFSTSDPIGLRGGINTYLYVGANPITRLDPFGLASARSMKCGAKNGIKVQDNFGLYDFSSACEAHDACYGTCGNEKSKCDDTFLGGLLGECGNLDPSLGFLIIECQSRATDFYLAVRMFGGPAYRAGQEEGCQDCEKGAPQ